jgi:dTDP-4-amino-4,6-dideoxygalactose transaminase
MTIAAPPASRSRLQQREGDRAFAPLFPTLWPSMLVGRRTTVWPFPFQLPQARFVYLARYGIYDAARALGLVGREILFPAFFHSVELDAIVAAGVRPRFFPVGDQLRVDPADVATRIGRSTAAIYLIHYGGFPGSVDAITQLCRERGLLLIEDCAHALLSTHGGQPLGSFGDAAVFSFPKVVPVPNGGVVTMRRGWPDRFDGRRRPWRVAVGAHAGSSILLNLQMRGIKGSRRLREAAIGFGKAAFRAAGADHMSTGTPLFDRSCLDLTMSAIAWRVLEHQDFDEIVRRRRRNYLQLLDQLGDVVAPIFDGLPAGVSPLFYGFQLDDRDLVLARLKARGVEIGEFWPEWHPAVPHEFPAVERLRRTALWLPCHQDLTAPAIDRLAEAVKDVVREVRG